LQPDPASHPIARRAFRRACERYRPPRAAFRPSPTALIAWNRGWQMKHQLGVRWGTPSSAVVDVLPHTVGPLRRSLSQSTSGLLAVPANAPASCSQNE
jgi:hypothetical protein